MVAQIKFKKTMTRVIKFDREEEDKKSPPTLNWTTSEDTRHTNRKKKHCSASNDTMKGYF